MSAMESGKDTSEHKAVKAANWKGWLAATLTSVSAFLTEMPVDYAWVPIVVSGLAWLGATLAEGKNAQGYALSRGIRKAGNAPALTVVTRGAEALDVNPTQPQ